MKALTQETLRSLVYYEPETGFMRWINPRNNFVKAGAIVGFLRPDGYRYAQILGRRYPFHRLVFLYVLGRMPKIVDHIDGNHDNNKWANLREATATENQRNGGLRRNNKSGVMGVMRDEKRRRWTARIRTGGKQIYLGSFSDLAEAAAARKSAKIRHGYHENHGQRMSWRGPR